VKKKSSKLIKIFIGLIILAVLGALTFAFLRNQDFTTKSKCSSEYIEKSCGSDADCVNYIKGLGATDNFINSVAIKCLSGKCLVEYEGC